MGIINSYNPIISTRRKGTMDDPYINIEESFVVKDNKVLLSEIPSEKDHVNAIDVDNNELYYEIYDGIPDEREFIVDYRFGIITFHPYANDKNIKFTYVGTGNYYLPAKRVWTKQNNGMVEETLGDIIEKGQTALDNLDHVVEITNAAIDATENANNAAALITNAEEDRVLAEANRVDAENLRISNEEERQLQESIRQSQELEREDNENLRKAAEIDRENAESIRASNELIRESQEATRQDNELTRQSNEEDRQARDTEFQVWEEYDSDKLYKPLNKVVFQGSSYICKVECQGVIPTDTDYWLKIASSGSVLVEESEINGNIKVDSNEVVVYTHPDSHPASIIEITDDGEYFESTNVEDALQEIASKIKSPEYSEPQETTESIITLPSTVVEGQFSDITLKGNTRINYADGTADQFVEDKIQDNKYYIYYADLTCTSETGAVRLWIQVVGGNTIPSGNAYSEGVIGLNISKRVGIKLKVVNKPDTCTLKGIDYINGGTGTIKNAGFEEITEEEYNNLTVNEILQKYKYISTGVVSTESVRVTSTINLFDWQGELAKSNLLTYEIYNNRRCLTYLAGGYAEQLLIGKGKFEGYKQYTITGQVAVASGTTTLLAKYTDGTSDTISFIATQTFASFKYTSIAGKTLDYICGTWNAGQKVYLDIDTFQIVEGTDEKEYSPYGIGGEAYIDYVGNSLPNGTKDEVNVITGEKKQKISDDVVLNGNMNWTLDTSDATGTTVWVEINSILTNYIATESSGSATYGTNADMIFSSNIPSGNIGRLVFVKNVGTGKDRLYVKLPLYSTTLQGVKDYLNQKPITLIYQLASEISEKGTAQALTAYPNGHIIVEPVVKEVNTYNNGITIKKVHLPIKTLESVYKINSDNSKTAIDISTCTIASDGKSFTSTALTNSDDVEYTYFYDSSLSTLPTIKYSYPINLKAVVNSNTKAISNISESLYDLWLYIIGGI